MNRGVLLAVLLLLFFSSCSLIGEISGGSPEGAQSLAEAEPSPKAAQSSYPELTMSADLFSFHVEISGHVYALPCPAKILYSRGWRAAPAIMEKSLAPGEYMWVFMENEGAAVFAALANKSGSGQGYDDWELVGISSIDRESPDALLSAEISLPGGMSRGRERKALLEAYGPPDSPGEQHSGKSIKYSLGKNSYVDLVFDENDRLWGTELFNIETPPPFSMEGIDFPDIVKDWKAPLSLEEGEGLVFSMDGAMYGLPGPLKYFFEQGWGFADADNSEKEIAAGGFAVAVYLRKGSQIMRVNLENYTDEPRPYASCFVTMVESSENGPDVDLVLPGGISRKSSSGEVAAALGEDFVLYRSGEVKRMLYGSGDGLMRFDFEGYDTADERMVYIQLRQSGLSYSDDGIEE